MADFLNIGTSALLTIQRSIATTGHNIANVNTEGYTRQRVDLSTRPAQLLGSNYVGSGVVVSGIDRVYDQFLTEEIWNLSSSNNSFETYHTLSSRLDNMLADPSIGLGPAIDSFFNSVQDVANNPGSLPERNVLLGEAETLVSRFHYLNDRMDAANEEVNARIESSIGEINTLAARIAQLNDQIISAQAQAGGGQPNDLLDARDLAVSELASKIRVNVVNQDNGAVNVMIGNGQTLVVGSQTNKLQAVYNPYDVSKLEVGMVTGTGVFNINRFVTGGELGGALNFRDQVLDPARDQLGLIAIGLSETFNAQHNLGMDLNGLPGGDFFASIVPQAAQHADNTGSAIVGIDISAATQLRGDEYDLRFQGGTWTLTNMHTGVSQSGAGPFVMDGMTVTPGGAPAEGDRFQITPTRQGALLFDVVMTRPENFAAASPVRSSATLGNAGTASLDDLFLTDTTSMPLAGQVTLTFNPNALGAGVPGYDVAGIAGGPIPYDPATDNGGLAVTLGGMAFTLRGVPQAGDTLRLENNVNGFGDNRNALAMADLQMSKLLNSGQSSYQDTYAGLVGKVASETRQAKGGAETEAILMRQTEASRQAVSGVNLDEEAAKLLQLQQSYQAAAQIIAIADELFQTLLGATRR